MDRTHWGALADVVAALAFAAVAASILIPLVRTGQLRRNRLDLAAALVFASSSVGYVIQFAWALTAEGEQSGGRQLAIWDVLTAIVAIAYLQLRRVNADPEDGSGLYEDARRRQHELAGQVMAANVREELANERASAAEQRFARAFLAATAGMALLDRRGRITKANPALAQMLAGDPGEPVPAGPLSAIATAALDARPATNGAASADAAGPPWIDAPERPARARRGPPPAARLIGKRLSELVAPDDRAVVEGMLGSPADAAERTEVQIERADGTHLPGLMTLTPLPDDDGSMLVQVEDISDRRRAEERLEHLTLHDPLTGLPNRLLFLTRASAAIRQANRTGCYVGCLFVDLDDFKVVNDSLGHAAGDQVLVTMAERLVETVRPGDTVARMGGDEFCLLLVGLEHQAEGEVVSQRVRAALDGVIDLDGVQLTTSGSVGVAVALPGDRATSETLLRDADIALCQAKAAGRGRTVVFDAEMRTELQHRLDVVADPLPAAG